MSRSAKGSMRIGLMVGSDKERPRKDRFAGLIDDARAAEGAGFASFWMPQVPGYLDAMTALALIGQATDRIELGTAVLPIQTRHPMIMAQQALTTQEVCAAGSLSASGRHITGSSRVNTACPMTCRPSWCATIWMCWHRRWPGPELSTWRTPVI